MELKIVEKFITEVTEFAFLIHRVELKMAKTAIAVAKVFGVFNPPCGVENNSSSLNSSSTILVFNPPCGVEKSIPPNLSFLTI